MKRTTYLNTFCGNYIENYSETEMHQKYKEATQIEKNTL